MDYTAPDVPNSDSVGKSQNVIRLKVKDLRPHPKQDEFFARRSEAEDQALADDMSKNGQQHSIHVLTDKRTIIAGNRRHRAATLNGWDEIDAIIRDDLEEAGELAVEEFLINDNFNRRHCSQLERARCAERLVEIEMQQARPDTDRRNGDLRARDVQKRVGELLGIGDRQVRRFLRILDAPAEVQDAYEAGELHIDLAGKVASLGPETQSTIAGEIANGDDPKEVINWYINESSVRQKGPNWRYRKFVDSARNAVDALSGRVGEIQRNAAYIESDIEVLGQTADLIECITDHLGQQQ
jgi:ParB-like chromosome segregation protein Spo0J